MEKLDLYDKKILYELDINSRITLSALSKKIKLPKATTNYRLSRLIKKEYIKSFHPLIDASRLGFK